MLTQMVFQHFRHQPVDGATNRCNLLQDSQTLSLLLDSTLKRRRLTLNSADTGEQLLTAFEGVCHAAF